MKIRGTNRKTWELTMFRGARWRQIVREIASGQTRPLTRQQRRHPRKRQLLETFHVDEDGKISFISVFVIMAFVLLIGLVTNAGISVKEKIELQNAADATAYSDALWVARSMNAVTTANHMMGEVTALSVILDSFGGPMLGNSENYEYTSNESRAVGQQAESFKAGAPISTGGIFSSFIAPLDQALVEFAFEQVIGDKPEKVRSGAALYEARHTLRLGLVFAFGAKNIAAVVLDIAIALEKIPIVQFVGYGLEAVIIPVHLYLSAKIAEIVKESLILEVVETLIGGVNKRAVHNGIRTAAETMTLYADTVVGVEAARKLGQAKGPLNQAIRETNDRMMRAHQLAAAETLPDWKDIQLPVTVELLPYAKEQQNLPASLQTIYGTWEHPGSEWQGDFESSEMRAIRDKFEPLREKIEWADDKLGGFAKGLGKLAGEVGGFLSDVGGTIEDGFNTVFGRKKKDGGPSVFDLINQQIKAIERVFTAVGFLTNLPQPEKRGYAHNPCLQSDLEEEYQLSKFYWKRERRCQYVRATYPYVDDYRAPIIDFFREHTKLSNVATYYANWSNRYTLEKSYLFRRDENQATDDSGKTEEKGLFAQLKAKVRDLRRRFDDATDTRDEEAAGQVGVADFEKISVDLLAAIDGFRGKISWLEQWFRDVDGHQQLVEQLGQSVSAERGADISQQNLEGLTEQLARINLLDELLTLLEEITGILEIKPPHMYVMKYSDPESKGNEFWVNDSELAEELFVLIGMASRESHPMIFAPALYGNHLNKRRTAFAQAIVYNANGRDPGNANPGLQPNTGWDTLNWMPPVEAPEWGDHEPSRRNESPLDLFGSNRRVERPAEVQLNWQVKLVPLTESNLTRHEAELKRLLGGRMVDSSSLINH